MGKVGRDVKDGDGGVRRIVIPVLLVEIRKSYHTNCMPWREEPFSLDFWAIEVWRVCVFRAEVTPACGTELLVWSINDQSEELKDVLFCVCVVLKEETR